MSLINAFNAMGSALAQSAGDAIQQTMKNDAEMQRLQVGNALTTQRETALQQGAQAGASDLLRQKGELEANAATLADQRLAARESAGRQEAFKLQEQATPEQIKLLRALGVMPTPGAASTAAPASSASGAQLAPRTATVSPPNVSGSNDTPSGSSSDLMSNPLVMKVLGQPATGSEASIRAAIAQGVNNDPQFKGATADQKAIETEKRYQVASSKVGSPESLHAIAKAISTYDLSPLDQRARMMSGGPDQMADVLKLNSKYSETKYDTVKEVQKAIVPGGNLYPSISAMNTSLEHAQQFLDTATELGNYSGGNWANIIPNKIAANTGHLPLVNALQQTAFAMAEEGNRIYAGNAGTESAITNWYKTFPVNGSLADQAGAVKNFAKLMGGKFNTIASDVNKTFEGSGLPAVHLLSPQNEQTFQNLITLGPNGKPAANGRPPLSSFMPQ